MKINHKFLTPPRAIFTFFLTLALLTGCMTESDSGSDDDNGQAANPTENTSISYTITFCSNGGDGGTSPADITAKSGEEVTLPACTFTRTGYDFKGWCRFTDGTGTIYEAGEKVKDLNEGNGDVTLFAKWVLAGNWSISYVLNGDALNPAQNSSENPTEYNIETEKVTLYAPERRFYEFAGWYINPDFSSDYMMDWYAGVVTGDVKLYAKWTVTCNSITAAIEAGETEIKLAGKISEDEIGAIGTAIRENSNTKLTVDLGGTTGAEKIPDEYYAFKDCTNLTGFVFPASVTKIGISAFENSGIESIVIPGTVKTVGSNAFSNCSSLSALTIEDGVESIGEKAFSSCSALKDVTVPASVAVAAIATLESGTDDNEPSYIIKITDKTLSSEQLSDIGTAIKTLTTKENYFAFINLDLSSATELTEIPDEAFYYFYLSGLILPDSLKNIGTKAFAYNGFEEIVIPDSVEIIEAGAISFCLFLTEITLPASLTSIGASAFKGTALKTVNYKGTQEQWEEISIHTTGNDKLTGAKIICTDGVINGE